MIISNSATPKLYTPKISATVESTLGPRPISVDMPRSMFPTGSLPPDKRAHAEPSKFPPIMPSVADPLQSTSKKSDKKKKKVIRVSGGTTWEDPTLTEWEDGKIQFFEDSVRRIRRSTNSVYR